MSTVYGWNVLGCPLYIISACDSPSFAACGKKSPALSGRISAEFCELVTAKAIGARLDHCTGPENPPGARGSAWIICFDGVLTILIPRIG